MHVLIVNQHGDNRGDEAALRAVLTSLEERLDPVRFTVVHQFADPSTAPAVTQDVTWLPMRLPLLEAARLGAYGLLRSLRLRPRFLLGPIGRATIDAYETADVVVSAPGGPYFGDLYAGHEPVHWFYVWLARWHRRPSVLFAPSAGPFAKRWMNPFRRATYRCFERVIVREERSAEHIRGLFTRRSSQAAVTVEVAVDAALQIDVPPLERVEVLHEGEEQLVVVSAIDWGYRGDPDPAGRRARYDAAVVAAVHHLARTAPTRVVLVPQLHGAVHRDTPYLERLAARFEGVEVEVLDASRTSDDQRALVAAADWVVAGRYHPAVFAVSAAVPVLALAYEHKASGFMEVAGLADAVVPIEDVSAERLCAVLDELRSDLPGLRTRLQEAAERLRARAALPADAVASAARRG